MGSLLTSFPAASPQDLAGSGIYRDAEASGIRKVIAKRLQQSKHEIPHYYLTVECRMDKIMALRKEINATYEKEGVKLSVNDFVIKAVALACKRVPECNSAWMETFIRTFHTCDVSVAVDTGSGLITPIVTGVEGQGGETSATRIPRRHHHCVQLGHVWHQPIHGHHQPTTSVHLGCRRDREEGCGWS